MFARVAIVLHWRRQDLLKVLISIFQHQAIGEAGKFKAVSSGRKDVFLKNLIFISNVLYQYFVAFRLSSQFDGSPSLQ